MPNPSPSELTCPACQGTATTVLDSRGNQEASSIRRRRRCDACGFRFSTYETTIEIAEAYRTLARVLASVRTDAARLADLIRVAETDGELRAEKDGR